MKIEYKNVRSTIGSHMLADGMKPVIDLKNSHGSWLVDGTNGKEYLDLFSMYASMSVGYNHPYVLNNSKRLEEASVNKPANSDIYSIQMAEFVDTMGKIVQPSYLPYAFYIEGGALAVENALKIAFDWKSRKNLQEGKAQGENLVVHLKDCFHGRTGYTMSLTDSPDKRKVQYFPKFNWPRIINPYITFPENKENIAIVEELERKSIDELKNLIKKSKDDIACLILEPIQGEGGDNHFRQEYFKELKILSQENDFLLIYDEVQTGIGITGKMWAHQHFCEPTCQFSCMTHCKAIEPDIISFGKKTQVCGVFAGERLNEVENHVFHESSRINSTFGGNLVDMVRFTIYAEIIQQEKLVDNARENGQYLLKKLRVMENNYANRVSNSRGKGLFCAFDLDTSSSRDKLISNMEKEGAIILGCGHKSVRFRPHLNISKKDIDIACDMLNNSLKKL
ncbi:MAG: L-lysine 6-transaminase [Candidatus Marinimicrobia bacterium]|nr:L-lysine 6-transaminase [Candidatus Neomarinimicrobiota bacterium]|tara:strand:+ start:604 stop:1956 length:1353 start_codon:yes stop_codon:yes gene_type:complete